jgi:GAF domain-containing protein
VYDQLAFLRTLSAATADMVRSYDTITMLENLTERVTGVLGLAGSGVTLETDGKLTFVTAVSDSIRELEVLQENLQQGPCIDAFHSGKPEAVSNALAERERWPDYAELAGRLGLGGVAGIPMTLESVSIGALDLYSWDEREWPEEDLGAAQALADLATVYLVNASKLQQQQQLAEQLQGALHSRVVIEQAKGIIAASEEISVDEAFQRIRAWARNHNQGLRAVAEEVVERGLRP